MNIDRPMKDLGPVAMDSLQSAVLDLDEAAWLVNSQRQNDFEVHKWAAPEFLQQAGKELLEDLIEEKLQQKIPTMQGRVG